MTNEQPSEKEVAWEAYSDAMALAEKTFDEVSAPAWEVYDKAVKTAQKASDEAVARSE